MFHSCLVMNHQTAKLLGPAPRACTHTHTHTHTHTDRHAWPFIHAVDWKELKIPEYPFVVSIPMDLSKVESRLFDGFYPNAHTFARDVRLTFQNALTFNAPEDEVGARVHRIGEILER